MNRGGGGTVPNFNDRCDIIKGYDRVHGNISKADVKWR